jgi:hypothetical protein
MPVAEISYHPHMRQNHRVHEAWQNVVIVNFNRDNRQVNVNANDRI